MSNCISGVIVAKGGAHLSGNELAKVLSYYDVGVIHEVKSLSAGNRRAPKVIVFAERGKFLLKRRHRDKDDPYRVALSHAVQMHLAKDKFPVAALIATREENSTILQLNHHIYELFEFIEGTRYDGSAEATIDAGRQMARFHLKLGKFNYELLRPLKGSFHDSGTVRNHIKTLGSKKRAPVEPMTGVADHLMSLYERASVRVNELGFDDWGEQIVHGDWHPGNMLFAEGKVAAVLDFDSVKIAPTVTDLANGMLQFSLVGGRPNPADWPAYLDQTKLEKFLDGYRQAVPLDEGRVESLLDLMVETIIAEAVLPVATTGFFGNLSGQDFLKMICRKAEWITDNRHKLIQGILVKRA